MSVMVKKRGGVLVTVAMALVLACTAFYASTETALAEASNEQTYNITFHTADVYLGGTDTDVEVRVGNKDGEWTEWHTLDAEGWDDFERDDYASYYFADKNIGSADKIEIKGDGWALDWFQMFGYDKVTLPSNDRWFKNNVRSFSLTDRRQGNGTVGNPYRVTFDKDQTVYAVRKGCYARFNEYWVLDLGGHTLTLDSGYRLSDVFQVGNFGNLTVKNGKININGNIKGNNDDYRGFGVYGGTLNLGEENSNTTLEIYGGQNKLIDSSGKGGGVYVEEPTGAVTHLNIYKGTTIHDCFSRNGGGVYLGDGAVMKTKGGEIRDCSASQTGAGICMDEGSTAIIDGTTIKDSTASQQGGGIYNVGELTTKDCKITGNKATGGDSYIRGGGIYYSADTRESALKLGDGTVITGNQADSGGGVYSDMKVNVYDWGKSPSLSGVVKIYGNNARSYSNYGGGFDNAGRAPFKLESDFRAESYICYSSAKDGRITTDYSTLADDRTSCFVSDVGNKRTVAQGGYLYMEHGNTPYKITIQYKNSYGQELRQAKTLESKTQGTSGIEIKADELIEGHYQFKYWQVEGDTGSVFLSTNNAPEKKNFSNESAVAYLTMPDHEVILTAVYAAPCKVSFDANGGSGTMNPVTKQDGETYQLPENRFTAPDNSKEFYCWDINGVRYKPGDSIKLNGDITVKAVWKKITYTVTLSAGNKAGDETEIVVNKGDTYTLPACEFLPDSVYQSFAGWKVGDSETLQQPGDEITVNSDITVTAVWNIDQVTITFDANGGSGTMDPVTVDKGTMYKLPGNGFTAPPGKAFECWSIAGVAYGAGVDSVEAIDDMTVTALWEPTAPACTITFEANGGTGSMDPVTLTGADDNDYILPSCGFQGAAVAEGSPYHKAFSHWNIDGVRYRDGEEINVTGNITCKAMWRYPYNVTYFANNETGDIAKFPVADSGKYTLLDYNDPSLGFQYDNHVFEGWMIGDNLKDAGTEIDVEREVIAVAKWKSKNATVSFDANGGTGSMDSVQVEQGTECVIPECTLTAPDNTRNFSCWTIDGERYSAGDKIVISKDEITIKAQWLDIGCTLSFKANGGSGEMKPMTVAKNADFALPDCGFQPPEDKKFKTWSVDGDSEERDPLESIKISQNTEVKALWDSAQYQITFDANGGSGTMDPVTVNAGDNYTLPACGFTAPDKMEFGYWLVDDTKYGIGDPAPIEHDTVIYAVWKYKESETFTVTYDANGGSGTMDPETVTAGDKLILPKCDFTAPEGKTFDCWKIGNDEREYYPNNLADITSDVTVKAVWKSLQQYTVTFDANGGSGTMSPVKVNAGDRYKLPDNEFTAPGGTNFKCWSINGTEYAVGDTLMLKGNTTVKAQWDGQIDADMVVLSVAGVTYNGKNQTPAVTVKVAGRTLTNGTDYTVAYSNNKNVGTATAQVTGKGAYTGTVAKTFNINPKGTKIKKLNKLKKGFWIKWKKQTSKMSKSRITGYQVRYSLNKSMEGAKIKTIKSYKRGSKKILKLQPKKKYYVQVRTYKNVGGKTYYSNWSAVKAKKTK